jgi:ABC-type antimicrobial peptide transport system permease subunit
LSLEERRREAGILRALGFSPSAIRLFLSLRALLLGLSAYLVALLAAWIYMEFEKSFAPIYVLGIPFLFQLSATNILTSLAWMFALPALGAWLATRRLLRDSVVFSLQRD